MDASASLRSSVRAELALGPSARRRRSASLLRWSALTALVWGLTAGGASAQAPYQQQLILGFSSFDAGWHSAPALADLDGDGDLDAVVGEREGALRYFVNAGLATAPTFLELTGAANPFAGIDVGTRSSPDLTDLDADGDLDAVVGETLGSLRYFANTGSSASPAFVEVSGSAFPFPGIDVGAWSSPTLGDLDGDGDLDAVVGNGYATLRYFVNTGSSTAPAFVEAAGTANPFDGIVELDYTSDPDLVDLDGDGDLDAVVAEFSGPLRYFENTGSSASPAFVQRFGGLNPVGVIQISEFFMTPELADLDGDGDLDTVVGDMKGSLHYYANTGSSASPAFVAVTGTASPVAGVDVVHLSSPELADLDGDGDLDAVVGESYGNLRYFANSGSSAAPAFVERTGALNPFAGIELHTNRSPELGDLDGDGDLDAVVGDIVGVLRYFANTGSSALPAFVEVTGAASPFDLIDIGAHSSPTLADLDEDSDLDAVVGESNGSLRYFENTGSSAAPAFVERTLGQNPFNGIHVGTFSSPDLVDVDGDGDLEAVVGERYGSLRYFVNEGFAPPFAFFVERIGSLNPFDGIDVGERSSPNLVDIDGDGDLDALVGENGGRLVFYRSLSPTGNGDLFTTTPCRLYDSRNEPSGPISGGQTRVIAALGSVGSCSLPGGAKNLTVNVTVVGATAAGYLQLYAAGIATPDTTVINFGAGQTRANNAVLSLAASGAGTFLIRSAQPTGQTVHVIVDVTGYFD